MPDYRARRRQITSTGASISVKIVLLVGFLLVLIVLMILLYVWGKGSYVKTDPESLCPTDRKPTEVDIILLDMTDEFTERQRLQVRNELEKLKEQIAPLGLIEVFAVDPVSEHVPIALLRMCKPVAGNAVNPLYQNPQMAQDRWNRFIVRLDTEMARLMRSPASKASPVFEAIQATALHSFNRSQFEKVQKRLVVVSDLLQNVHGKLSQYHESIPFSDFRRSPYFSEIRADLTGVEVVLFYLVRPRAPQKWPDHYRFWEEYFLDQGATVEQLVPIYGAK